MRVIDTVNGWWCQVWAGLAVGPPFHRAPDCEPIDRQRGSVTIENVIWALAVIVIAGIVVFAITTYVQTEADKIGEP